MKNFPDTTDLDEWIAAALLDELSAEDRAAFDRYLTENPEARALYHDTMAATQDLEEHLREASPAPNFEERLIQRVRERSGRSWATLSLDWLRTSWKLPYVYLPVGAAILLGMVDLGAVLTRQDDAPDEVAQISHSVAVYPTEYGKLPSTPPANAGSNQLQSELSTESVSQIKAFTGEWSGTVRNGSIVSQGIVASTGQDLPERQRLITQTAMGPTALQAANTEDPVKAIDSLASASPQGEPVDEAGKFANTGEIKLDASKGVDLMNAPTVTTKSGRQAVVRVAREFPYPTEFAANKDAEALGYAAGEVKNQRSADADDGAPAQGQGSAAVNPAVIDTRKLVRNAALDLEVKNYDGALDSITAIAAGNSGYVATKNSARLANGKMSGTVVVKVLPERLDAALRQIRELGELKNQSLSTQDITKEYFDTDARLRNARKMEERLLTLLDTMKGKVSELLQVEKELARVREQIEQMQGELKMYDGLVQFATITIALREKDLDEAAAYLLKESVILSLYSSDVEKTYEDARREAEADKAQILQSRLVRDSAGRATATVNFLIAPEAADGLIARIKGLGRVQNYNKDDTRVARDGSGDSTTAKVERDKVQLALTVIPDDDSRKQVGLTVVAKQVGAAQEAAKAAAKALGADILNASLQHTAVGDAASLSLRVPGANYEALLETLKKLGMVSQFAVQRDEAGGPEGSKAPVLIVLTLTDAAQPVQFTQAAVLTPAVEQRAAELKQIVATHQGETVSSNFERQPDGTQVARLVIRVPLAKYGAFFDETAKLGEVKDLTIQREDRNGDNPELATAQVALRLYSEGPVVAQDNGLMTTMRKTLGQGAGALMWSVRMIGVAVAFLAPWAVAVTAVIWVAVRMMRNRKARGAKK